MEICAVANRTLASARKIADEYAIPKVYGAWQELLADPGIDAVCVGSWPNTHFEITLAALKAGKHVLCQARMAMNLDEALAMLDAAKAAPHCVTQLVPSPLMLGKERIIHRLIAKCNGVLSVDMRFATRDFPNVEKPMTWRQDIHKSGMNTLALGIVYEAMSRWLGPADRVMAMTRIHVAERPDGVGGMSSIQVPDHVEILARLSRDSATAHLVVSSVTGLAPANQCWIFGRSGTLHLDFDRDEIHFGQAGEETLHKVEISEEEVVPWCVEADFIDAIRWGKPVEFTSFADGVEYMKFTQAVHESAQSGAAIDI